MANPLKTPDLIAPVWYYTPFYSMLRAATFPFLGLDAKFWGLVVMGGAIVLPAVLPWLDRSKVKSIRYKGMASKSFLAVFVVAFFVLGYLGVQHPTPFKTFLAQICTAIYLPISCLCPGTPLLSKPNLFPKGFLFNEGLSCLFFAVLSIFVRCRNLLIPWMRSAQI